MVGLIMVFYGNTSRHAIRALVYLAQRGDQSPCGAAEISESENIPRPFLSKILKRLVSAKILESRMGPGGGFILGKTADQIRMIEVIRLFEDIDSNLSTCVVGSGECSDDNCCRLHDEFKTAKTSINTVTLRSLALADEDQLRNAERAMP